MLNNNHKSNTQITPYLLNNLQVKLNKYIDINLLPLDGIDQLHLKKTCAIKKLPFSTNCNNLIYLIRHLTVPGTIIDIHFYGSNQNSMKLSSLYSSKVMI